MWVGGVGEINTCDEPAVRRGVGTPQTVVKVVAVRSEVEVK